MNQIQNERNDVIVASRTIRRSNRSSGNIDGNGNESNLSSCDGWNKMVTNIITLYKVAPGSKEDVDGYHFVALMPLLFQQQQRGGGI